MKTLMLAAFIVVVLAAACLSGGGQTENIKPQIIEPGPLAPKTDNVVLKTATFAGGCFWCLQPPFDSLNGVKATRVGFMGGNVEDPSYRDVMSGLTGHAEVLQLDYDPSVVSYEELLNVFWTNIDPTTLNGQFADTGNQYRTAVFYHGEEQKKLADKSKKLLGESGLHDESIVTEVVASSAFYMAEEKHQKYYIKSSDHYKGYKRRSGREGYLKSKYGTGDEPEKKK
jgi:methionine-S-sulfoxide reductase